MSFYPVLFLYFTSDIFFTIEYIVIALHFCAVILQIRCSFSINIRLYIYIYIYIYIIFYPALLVSIEHVFDL